MVQFDRDVRNLYTEKYKVILKEIKENPNWSIDSMLSQSKSQKDFVEIGNLIPKFTNGKMLSWTW